MIIFYFHEKVALYIHKILKLKIGFSEIAVNKIKYDKINFLYPLNITFNFFFYFNIIWSNKKYILWRVNSGDGKKTEAQRAETVSFTWNIFLSSFGQSISKLELWVTSLSDTMLFKLWNFRQQWYSFMHICRLCTTTV